MKKFILFSLCTIMFLMTALCSPHNGGSLTHQGSERTQNAKMYQDAPSIIPLQAICVQQIQTTLSYKVVRTKNVNSTLFLRNFLVNGKTKPVIFKEEIRFFPIFYYTGETDLGKNK